MPLTDVQRAARRHGLGGSDAAKLFGPDPDPLAVFASKVLDNYESESSAASELGTELEPIIRARAEKRLRVKIAVRNETVRHPEHFWMLANLDGEIGEDGIWECKCLDWRKAKELGESGSEQVLPAHFIQAQHYMEVCDRDWCVFTYLVGGNDERDFVVHRDREFGAKLIALERAFWEQHVLPGVPPETSDPFALTAYFAQRFPVATKEVLTAAPGTGAEEALLELRDAKRAEKAAKQKVEAAKARVQAILGSASKLEAEFGKATWTASKSVAWSEVAKALGAGQAPQIVKEHTKTGRTFRASFTGESDSSEE